MKKAILALSLLPLGLAAPIQAAPEALTEFELINRGVWQFLLEKRTGCMWKRALPENQEPTVWVFDGPYGNHDFCRELLGRLVSKQLGEPING